MRSSMPRPLRWFLLASLVALAAGAAATLLPIPHVRAIPPPLSAEALTAESQLVVVADVLGVACTGRLEGGRLRYAAWLQVLQTEKGGLPPHSTFQITWKTADMTLLGSWQISVYPGDRVQLYLLPEENEKAAAWRVFHPSGVKSVVSVPKDLRKLPGNVGEVLFRPAPSRPTGPTAAPKPPASTPAPAKPPAAEPR